MRRSAAGVVLGAALFLGALTAAPAWAVAPARTSPVKSSVGPGPVHQAGDGWLTGRRQRLLAVWILVDTGGLLFWYGSAPARRPRLLGSVGAHRARTEAEDEPEVPVRGIGRFARPRSGPPGRL